MILATFKLCVAGNEDGSAAGFQAKIFCLALINMCRFSISLVYIIWQGLFRASLGVTYPAQ